MPDTLFVVQGNDQGRRFVLTEASATAGRDSSNTIRLHDFEVSRRHAEIYRNESGRYIRDLSSSNGTFVNGRRVKTHKLVNGDQILIGKTTLLFGAHTIDTSARDPLVDVLQDADVASSSRILHSLVPEEGLDSSERSSENAVLASWVERARVHLNFICCTTLATSKTLDVKRLLDRILELIFQWAPVDRGCIFLYDSETNKLTPKSSRTRKENARVRVSQTILNYAFENQKGVLTSNARADRRWDGAASVLQTGVKEAICVPMQGRYGPVGMIYIDVSRSCAAVETNDERVEVGSESFEVTLRNKKVDFDDANFRLGDEVPLNFGTSNVASAPRGGTFRANDSDYSTPSQESSYNLTSQKLTLDHLKLMVAIGRQAALAVEDTQYFLGMAQAERLATIGQTVAVLSHHIKNILQGMTGGSYLVQRGLDVHDEAIIRKGWNIVEKNQAKISDLVLEMLTFSKERTPNWTRSPFCEVMRDVIELMNGRAAELGVQLCFSGACVAPPFFFDREQIHRAITNLILNALEASKEFGEDDEDDPATNASKLEKSERRVPRVDVLLETCDEGKKFRLIVDDSGQGVPLELRDSIFRPFVSKNKSGGTGLGLAATHKIVQEHNGKITVEDSPLGGARFVMEIPVLLVKPTDAE